MRKKQTVLDTSESVKVNKELMAQLRALASERGSMVSWLLNKAVSQFLANEREVSKP